MTVAVAVVAVLGLVSLALVALMLIHRPLRRRLERVRRSRRSRLRHRVLAPVAPEVRLEAEAHLNDVAPIVRAVAADLLGQLGAVTAVPDLVRVMGEDPDTAVRTSCARALGLVGSPQVRSALVGALDGRQEPVLRAGAAGALGGLGDPRAVGALGASLQGDHDAVAAASAHALARCGDAGLACLRSVAAGSGRSADHAAEALGAHALDEERPSGLVPA